jgi:hypothetical protein
VGADRDLARVHTRLGGLPAIAEFAGVVRQGQRRDMAVVEDTIVVELYLDMGEPVELMLYRMTAFLFRG